MIHPMQDLITGTSILAPLSDYPGIFRLWFVASRRDGQKNQGHVSMAPDGMPNVPKEINGYAVWRFRRASPDSLACHPSVNWISWEFHNAFDWSTSFLECLTDDAPASEIHYALNWQSKDSIPLSDHELVYYRETLFRDGILRKP